MLVSFCSSSCIPAEAEPLHNSSECYPLVNFTRPFCQNHGIDLPSYVYREPKEQIYRNYYANKYYDMGVEFDESKISKYYKMDVASIRQCRLAYVPMVCHYYFPACDRTRSVFRKKIICRETCLEFMALCDKILKDVAAYYTLRFKDPLHKKFVKCQLQPYRNAGDSPECWYYDIKENLKGNNLGRLLRHKHFRAFCV